MIQKNKSLNSKLNSKTPPTYTPFDSRITSPPSITSTKIDNKNYPYGEPRRNEHTSK